MELGYLLNIIENLGLLCSGAVFVFLVASYLHWSFESLRHRIVLGLVLGLISVLVVNVPIQTPLGATFDTRAGPIILAGFLGGPVTGGIAAVIGGIARYSVGGPVAIGGVVSFFLYAIAGILASHYVRHNTGQSFGILGYFKLSLFATVVVLPAFFVGLDVERGLNILANFWPLLLLGNITSTVILGISISFVQNFVNEHDHNRLLIETGVVARQVSHIGMWSYNLRTGYLDWDDSDYGMRDHVGINVGFPLFQDRIVAEDLVRVQETYAKALQSKTENFTIRFDIAAPDGKNRTILVQGCLVRDRQGRYDRIVGVNRDESDELRLIKDLEMRSQALASTTCGVMISEAGNDRKAVYVNDGFCKMTGYARHEVLGRNCRFLNQGIDNKAVLQKLRKALGAHEACKVVIKNKRKDGSEFWNQLQISPIFNRDGIVTHFIGIQNDVTADFEMRQTIEDREARWQSIVTTASDGIVNFDEKGRILAVNPAVENMFLRDEDQLLGEKIGLLVEDLETNGQNGLLVRYHDHNENNALRQAMEMTGLRSDLSEFPVDVAIGKWYEGGQIYYTAIIRDMSQRRALQEQLFQTQKIETIGKLTGGIAHDFNNNLTVIRGNLELLADSDISDKNKVRLDRATRAVERAVKLTSRLMAFARKQPLKPTFFHLNDFLESMTDLYSTALSSNITVRLNLKNDYSLKLDIVQLENAILNVIVNARHAMPDGGHLDIATVTADQRIAEMDPVKQYVRIDIKDTGEGMDEETLAHAVEPFFTTKKATSGTGLGLSSVQGFVAQSGGFLKISSQKGVGTSVSFILPVEDIIESENDKPEEPAYLGVEKTEFDSAESATASILLVEDEEDVRLFIHDILTGKGYRVVSCPTALQALDILKRERHCVDMVISDIMLQGDQTGIDLKRQIEVLYPDLAILLITGYAGEALEAERDGDFVLLRKPFGKDELLDKIVDLMPEKQLAATPLSLKAKG